MQTGDEMKESVRSQEERLAGVIAGITVIVHILKFTMLFCWCAGKALSWLWLESQGIGKQFVWNHGPKSNLSQNQIFEYTKDFLPWLSYAYMGRVEVENVTRHRPTLVAQNATNANFCTQNLRVGTKFASFITTPMLKRPQRRHAQKCGHTNS